MIGSHRFEHDVDPNQMNGIRIEFGQTCDLGCEYGVRKLPETGGGVDGGVMTRSGQGVSIVRQYRVGRATRTRPCGHGVEPDKICDPANPPFIFLPTTVIDLPSVVFQNENSP